ncbi:MAG: hypothetical protein ACLP9L_39810 [Thermoguttaceae bacterium]
MLYPGKNWAAGLLHCLLLACSIPLAAQDVGPLRSPDKDSPASAETTEGSPRRIEETRPSLYYLKDKQGNLQAVPNFTLEDFEKLYKLEHQLVQGDQRPRYSLQEMLATGTVNTAGQAELSIQFRILVREDQWTRIPLRLDQAVLRETAQYQGSGEHFLSFEGEGDGFVAWVRGAAGQQHQITLKMLVPLTMVGQETRLRLLAPRATTSQLKLKVPYAKAMARVSEGATLQTPGGDNKETELTVVGLNGDFELSWHSADAAPGRMAALEAFGNIATRLDGRGVETEATFSVRSYGDAFDRFQIRLPPDAEFVPGAASGYTLTAVNAGAAPSSSGRQRLVEVRFAKRTVGPVEVRLSTKRAASLAPATRGDNWLELAGFEFPEATRQWGTIAVSVAGDWQVLWGPSRGVRQIDQLPDALRRKDVTAGFEYFAQPPSLTARLVPRKTRIGVDPEYVLLVDSDQVRLEARLRYTVRGARVFAVDIAMPDWQIDEVGPEGVVAIDGVPAGASGPVLSLPLVSPTIGPFEIRLKAHWQLPAEAKSLSLRLPQPQASAPAAAVVAVIPADNVEILPDSQATTGLLRQQVAVPLELPLRQQEPLFYRSDAPKAVFAAELRRHRQKITASVASRVMMDPAGGRVDQKFVYTIAYEPTDYFLLEVPRELSAKGRMVLNYEDQILVPVVLSEETDDGVKPLRMRVALPKSCIGPCEITARYSLTPTAGAADGNIHVPLVMPLDAELTGNSVLITPGAEQQVEVVSGAWTAVASGLGQAASSRTLELVAAQRTAGISLKLHGESGGDAAVVVDRAWFQTCLTKSAAAARQDRAVLQLTTRRHELEITLPEGAARNRASVQLNGMPVNPRLRAERVLVIPLSADAEPASYRLSLQYDFPGARATWGAMKFEFPSLGDDAWIQRAYWQLLLPPEEHLVVSPGELTGEFVWGWNHFYFGRQPVLSQTDLAGWVDPGHTDSTPALTGMNVYLFSSLGRIGRCEIVTVGRSTIVFVSSGIALLAGLLLIYVKAARHPVVLLMATAILAGLAATYPELALMAAQASAVGLALALLAAFLRQLTMGSRPPLPTEASSTVSPILPMPRPSETAVPVVAAPPTPITPMPPDAAT